MQTLKFEPCQISLAAYRILSLVHFCFKQIINNLNNSTSNNNNDNGGSGNGNVFLFFTKFHLML